MSELLRGKVALVTGAGRGIGRAIATALASEGARLALTGRNISRLEQVKGEIKRAQGQADAWQMDVSQESSVKNVVGKIIDHWGQIDILVNNAAIIHPETPVWNTPILEWDEEMNVNLRGTFLCCHFVLPHMVKREEGVVINIGSSSGTIAEDLYGAYGATKWGVIGYTISLAKSVRQHGVRVNGLNPGWVETDMTASTDIPSDAGPEWTQPEDIARASLFLAAHAPADMTGQFINLFGANDHSGHAPSYIEK
ncbi:MAG: SDR family oxidoreductase [Chloroflexota bacterium]|nr:SDR family oxidoreductase [Chloroflexota bacterium]